MAPALTGRAQSWCRDPVSSFRGHHVIAGRPESGARGCVTDHQRGPHREASADCEAINILHGPGAIPFVPFPAGPNLRFGTAHTFRQVAQIRNVAEVKWPQRGLENYVSAGMPTNRSAHTASGVVSLSGSASVANNSSRALRRRKTSTSGSILALTFELFCWKFQNLRQGFPRTAEIILRNFFRIHAFRKTGPY